jgi:predicted nuclease of predicted toxin-antitoxin system
MRLLLDENVPEAFGESLLGHEVRHVVGLGLSGTKNGALLSWAEQNGFDVLITHDRGFRAQHNMAGRRISVIIVRPRGKDFRCFSHLPSRSAQF